MSSLLFWTLITWLHLIIQTLVARKENHQQYQSRGAHICRGNTSLSRTLNVTIISENFYNLLKWSAVDDDSTNTRYTVEVMKLGMPWKVVPRCLKISARDCELSQKTSRRLFDIHDRYWARVIVESNENNATCVESQELLPYSQTVIGPPHLSFNCSNQVAVVALSMPLTPIKTNEGRNMRLSEIFLGLKYIIKLYNEDMELEQEVPRSSQEWKETVHSFSNLRPSTNYCVTARLDRRGSHSREHVMLCCTTSSTEHTWISVLLITLTAVMASFMSCVFLCLLRCYRQKQKQKHIPKALALLSEDLCVDLTCKDKDDTLEGDHISIVSAVSICQTYEWKPQFTHIQLVQDDHNSYGKDKNSAYKNYCNWSAIRQSQSESNSQVFLNEENNSDPPCLSFKDPSGTVKSVSAAMETVGTDFTSVVMLNLETAESNVSCHQNLQKGYETCGVLTSEQTNILKNVKPPGLIDSWYQSNIPLSSVKLLACEEMNSYDWDLESVGSLINVYSVEIQTADDSDSVTHKLWGYKSVAEEDEPFLQRSNTSNVGYKSYPVLCEPIQITGRAYESHNKPIQCTLSEMRLNLPT
ncbi:interferon alpha/beta receptor 1-like [Protopterus annectens]|uniref:interferon alpha/beta receptor 1-like n=1 Tax=Protopterus annectens TaxID=7888 RepID=UPI001CFB6CCA|nr:interferon alpha/beta receptor 1-like [Protopterus annectens]